MAGENDDRNRDDLKEWFEKLDRQARWLGQYPPGKEPPGPRLHKPTPDPEHVKRTVETLYTGYRQSKSFHGQIDKLAKDAFEVDKLMIGLLDSSVETGVLAVNTSYTLEDGKIMTVVMMDGSLMIAIGAPAVL